VKNRKQLGTLSAFGEADAREARVISGPGRSGDALPLAMPEIEVPTAHGPKLILQLFN